MEVDTPQRGIQLAQVTRAPEHSEET